MIKIKASSNNLSDDIHCIYTKNVMYDTKYEMKKKKYVFIMCCKQ